MLGIIVLILTVVGIAVKGFVIAILWGWFIVPIFGGPELSIMQAVGMAFTVQFIIHNLKRKDFDNAELSASTTEDDVKYELAKIALWFVGLGFGYIYTLFL